MGSPGEVPWQAIVLTLFPEAFPGPLGLSLAGTALEKGLWALKSVDIRAFASDKHRSVDDAPYGGGAGMVMRPDVVAAAIDGAKADLAPENRGLPLIYMTPRGRPLTQERAAALAEGPGLMVLCGRFEGVDQRVLDHFGAEEISVGDAVLSGGEIPAMALIDACVRLIPGVIGQPESLTEESFEAGLLEYPHYTRPSDWQGRAVPEVLISGNHAKIGAWRRSQSEELTKARRPDLWERYVAENND